MADIRVGIMGCGGRMGRMLVAEAQSVPGVTVAGGSERPDSALIGRDLGELAGLSALGLTASADAAEVIAAADVAIDFTAPAATVAHARMASQRSTAMVIGTTGLDAAQAKALETAARPSFATLPAKSGTKAALKAPSAKRLRNILGNLSATKKASETGLAPRNAATSISRTKPKTRLTMV